MKMGISGSVTKMMTADVMSCTAMTIRVMGVSVTDKTRAGRYPVRYGPRPSTPRVTTVAISSRRGSRSRGLIAAADVSTPFLISATTRVDARCAYLVCQPGPQNPDRHSCGQNNQFGCPRRNIHSSSGDHSGQYSADHERRDDDHHDVHHRQSDRQDQIAARRGGMAPQSRVDRPPATLPSGGSVAYFDSHVNSTVSSFVFRIFCDCGFATTTSSSLNRRPIDAGICLEEMRCRNTQYVQPW